MYKLCTSLVWWNATSRWTEPTFWLALTCQSQLLLSLYMLSVQCMIYMYEIYTCLLSSTAYFSLLHQLTQLKTSQSHSNTDSEPRSQASTSLWQQSHFTERHKLCFTTNSGQILQFLVSCYGAITCSHKTLPPSGDSGYILHVSLHLGHLKICVKPTVVEYESSTHGFLSFCLL